MFFVPELAMDKILSLIGEKADPRIGGGDSFADRLSSRYTATLLILFAVLLTSKQYYGEPIDCWCPAHFHDSHVKFTNAVCWVQNTYYLPYDQEIPRDGESREMIGYYQWVGFFLIVQAVCFQLPRLAWNRASRWIAGMQVSSVTDLAVECQNATDVETREKAMDYMTTRLFRFLKRKGKSTIRSNDLVIVYLIFKLVYISHAVFQIFVLNMFLGSNYANYGVEVLVKLLDGRDLMNSKRFPRVTMCDFKIRLVGNLQRYTVQCALPINLYNEIIFIFIWFWFILITFVSGYSFCFFLFKAIHARGQIRFVESRIESGIVKRKGDDNDNATKLTCNVRENYEEFTRKRREQVSHFVKYNLRGDGVFLLRMVAWNSSGLIAVDLVTRLWDIYIGKSKCPKDNELEENQPLIDRSTSIS